MSENHLDRNLEIYFGIYASYNYAVSPSGSLIFKSSNYDLSSDEKMRASLRPRNLILDNKVVYTKTNEEAYLDKNEENILKINYCKLDHRR